MRICCHWGCARLEQQQVRIDLPGWERSDWTGWWWAWRYGSSDRDPPAGRRLGTFPGMRSDFLARQSTESFRYILEHFLSNHKDQKGWWYEYVVGNINKKYEYLYPPPWREAIREEIRWQRSRALPGMTGRGPGGSCPDMIQPGRVSMRRWLLSDGGEYLRGEAFGLVCEWTFLERSCPATKWVRKMRKVYSWRYES